MPHARLVTSRPDCLSKLPINPSADVMAASALPRFAAHFDADVVSLLSMLTAIIIRLSKSIPCVA
jgi:hypothetical protein